MAVEFAETAGLVLDPWQRLVLVDALAQRPDGQWAAREAALVCPRQQGKGSVLEALELFALFMPEPDGPPALVLHSAHEYKTADEHFRRMRDLIDGSDQLRKQVRIVRTASGAQAIELVTGARLRFVTRTSGSGRGFSADLVVMDEAYNLSDDAMAAVLPTLAARPNPQLWYTSSAGMPSSAVLARVRKRGLQGNDPQLAYFEWSAADGSSLDDPEAWAQANPALGLRVSLDAVRAERAALSDDQFGRERLGLWADLDTLLALPGWEALADPSAPPGTDPVFAVAAAEDLSYACLSVAFRRSDGLLQVQTAEQEKGTAWLAAAVSAVRLKHGGRLLVHSSLRGVVAGEEVGPADYERACKGLLDGVEGARFRHYGASDSGLQGAVLSATWTATASRRLVGRGGRDICQLQAAALALHGASSATAPADFYML